MTLASWALAATGLPALWACMTLLLWPRPAARLMALAIVPEVAFAAVVLSSLAFGTAHPSDQLRLQWLAFLQVPALAGVAWLERRRLQALGMQPLAALAAIAGLGLLAFLTGLHAWSLVAPLLACLVTLATRRYDFFGDSASSRRQGKWLVPGTGAWLEAGLLAASAHAFDEPWILAVFGAVGTVLAGAYIWIALRTTPRRSGVGDDTRHRARLEPYKVMLSDELAAGATDDEAFVKLKSARASLGISDREHSILAIAVARRGPTTLAQIQPGVRFLDRYTHIKTLKTGGAGIAHLCRDERIGRHVVIKTVRSDTASQAALDALVKEAKAQGTVAHPNIVTLHDADRVGDEVFLVMEYLEGGSLAERCAGRPMPADALRRLGHDLLTALAAVHGSGLVHRDVKPSNIFLAKNGGAKLGDFGIAHLRGFATTVAGGAAVGTLRYMSPEQARGVPPGQAADLWGAAVTLYEAATGSPYVAPLPGETPFSLQSRIAGLKDFKEARWTPKQREFWPRALHPIPSKRFKDAKTMAAAFEAAWS